MTTPDHAAATYVPTWRGDPLPEPGREIKMKAHFTEYGRTVWRDYQVVVDEAYLDLTRTDRLNITVWGDDTVYRLDADNLVSTWRYTGDTANYRRPAAVPTHHAPDPAEMNEALREQRDEDAAADAENAAKQDRDEDEAVDAYVERMCTDPEYRRRVETATRARTPVMPPAHDETITGRIRRFIAVRRRREAIAAEEKALENEQRELNDAILELMIESEMDSPPGVDGMTVYLSPVYHAEKQVDPDTAEPYTSADILEALRVAGLAGMISEGYNGNQVRALLREYTEAKRELPDALARVLVLRKRYEVRVTPMAANRRKAAPNRS